MPALVVDYGGVLTTSVFESFRAFCRSERLEPDALVHLFVEDEQALADLHRLEVGAIGEEEFGARIAARLGVTADHLVDRLFAAARPDATMVGAIESARAQGMALALLSNSWGLGIYRRARALLGLFDVVILSGDVGLRKPQPEIFLLTAERLGVDSGDCVFVDDLASNCAAAESVGMTAVRHRSSKETVLALERLLGVPLGGTAQAG